MIISGDTSSQALCPVVLVSLPELKLRSQKDEKPGLVEGERARLRGGLRKYE